MHYDTVTFLLTAAVLWCVTVFILIREFRTGSFSPLFWIGLLAVYLIPCLADPFVADSLDWDWLLITVPDELSVYTRAAVFAIVFNVSYLCIRRYSYHFQGSRLVARLTEAEEYSFYLLMVAVFVFSVLCLSLTSSLSSAFSRTYGSAYEGRIAWLAMAGSYLFMAASVSLFVAFFKQRFRILAGLALVVAITYGLEQERKLLVVCLAPFAIHYLYVRFRSVGLAISTWRFVSTAAIVVCCFYSLVFVQIVRYQGNFFSRGIPALLDGVAVSEFMDAVGKGKSESPARWGYYYFMEPNVRVAGQFTARTYRRLALLPIPTSVIPDLKPRDYTEVYYASVFDDAKYDHEDFQPGTHHPLIYGDSFVNLGWYGVLLGGFWALAFNVVDWLLRRAAPFVQLGWIGTLGIAALMLARGSVYNSVALCYYNFLFVLLVAWGIGARPFAATGVDGEDVEEAGDDSETPEGFAEEQLVDEREAGQGRYVETGVS